MLTNSPAFSGFSVNNIEAAKEFYGTTLGLNVETIPQGFTLHLGGGTSAFVYSKPDHVPATFTILNFPVEDIDAAVDELIAAGITIEQYPDIMHQDEKGIARGRAANMGPDIAWFKDPAGNILSVLH